MIINYFCWSTVISLIAMILLYPLRNHSHGAKVSRFCAAVFLFPSLVSSLASLALILKKEVVLVSITRVPTIKVYLGILLSESNISIVVCINLSIAILIFFLSNRIFIEFFLISSLVSSFIFMTAATPDQFVRTSVFSLGVIIVNCIIISEDPDPSLIRFFTLDVIMNRVSDLLASMALIHVLFIIGTFIVNEPILNTDYIGFMPNLLFFLSIFIRIFSLHLTGATSPPISSSSIKFLIFHRMYIGVGSQLLLLYLVSSAPNAAVWTIPFLILSSVLFLYSAVILLLNANPFHLPVNIISFTSSINLLLIYFGQKHFATALIGATIVAYPVISLSFATRYGSLKNVFPYKSLGPTRWFAVVRILAVVYPGRILLFTSNIFMNFINLIYSGFLLYRLPQFLLTAIQMPLRFLNNGSIQRSLIFVAIMLIAYSYWWGDL